MSDALTWQLVKDQSCFLVKRNGNTRRSGAVQFTREPFNLTQKNSYKYSGLANSRAVDISVADKKITFGVKLAKKTRKVSQSTRVVPLNKDVRRGARTISSQLAGSNYRKDLQKAALARWCSASRVAKVQKGVTKRHFVKTGRKTIKQ